MRAHWAILTDRWSGAEYRGMIAAYAEEFSKKVEEIYRKSYDEFGNNRRYQFKGAGAKPLQKDEVKMKTIEGMISLGELPPGEWKMGVFNDHVVLACADHPVHIVTKDGEIKPLFP